MSAVSVTLVYFGEMGWMDQDETWHGTKVGLGPNDSVLDGTQLPQRGTTPNFSAHVRCDQTATWMKMPLGREVGLGPGYIVLDGDPAPLPQKRRSSPPIFGPFIVAKRLNGCHLAWR